MKKILYLVFIFFFFSCDIIEKPYIEQNGNCGEDNLSVPIKKVLLEDYTGHRCGNCPQAHDKIDELIAKYCDHIIPVCIHAGYFSNPTSGDYSTDFRTDAGNVYNDFFGNSAAGLPNGLVNRSQYNSSLILTFDSWESAIVKLLESEPEIEVSVQNTFDTLTRELNCFISVDFLAEVNDEFMLNVWIAEDSIVDFQTDYENDPVDIPDYVHRYVFRQTLSADWGDNLFSGTAEKNKRIEKTYSVVVDSSFNYKYCHIISFVSSGATKEVYQADDEKVFE